LGKRQKTTAEKNTKTIGGHIETHLFLVSQVFGFDFSLKLLKQ